MDDLKRNWWKVVVIVVVCLLLNTVLHLVVFPFKLPTDFAPSVLVEKDMVPLVAGPGMLIALGALAIVFVLIQKDLPGKRLVKGWQFGIVFTILWALGFIEVSALSATTLIDEVINGLPDAIIILLMSLLLGATVAQDTLVKVKSPKNLLTRVIIVAAAFFVGRYIAYVGLKTNSIFHPETQNVFIWTLAMATWIGILYGFVGHYVSWGHSQIARALYFTGVVFGIDWLLFNLFLPIFLNLPLFNLASRALLDLPFVLLGVFVSERTLTSVNR